MEINVCKRLNRFTHVLAREVKHLIADAGLMSDQIEKQYDKFN